MKSMGSEDEAMKRIFALLLVMLLLGACAGQAVEAEPTSMPITTTKPTTIWLPSITVVSNSEEHEPYFQMLYGTYYDRGQLIYEDAGIRLDKTETLPEIAYADDFRIVISEIDAVYEATVQCALYEHDEESIWAVCRNAIGSNPMSIENFTFPDEAGLYLLNVETSWRRGEEGACYAHVFKIRR